MTAPPPSSPSRLRVSAETTIFIHSLQSIRIDWYGTIRIFLTTKICLTYNHPGTYLFPQ